MIMACGDVRRDTLTRKGDTMKTNETGMEWEVVRGFGDVVDAPESCIDVEVVATFRNETDAAVFADLYYDANIEGIQQRQPEWWKSFFVVARRVGTQPATTWFAVYDTPDDSDYEGFPTEAAAMRAADRYVSLIGSGACQVYIVPVRDDVQIDPPGELWSLWDHLHEIPQERFTYLRRTGRYAAE